MGFFRPCQQGMAPVPERLHELLAACSQCGLCEEVCPAMRSGADMGPRGRAALVRQGLAAPDCLLCGRCATRCPAGIPLDKIFIAAHSAAPASLGLRAFCSQPARIDRLRHPAALCQQALALFLPRLASPAITRPARPKKATPQTREGDILYFAGCLERIFFPEIEKVALTLLRDAGFDARRAAPLCCSRPLLARGQKSAALATVRRALASLLEARPKAIIFSCPACLDAITRIWPDLPGLSAAEREKAQALAAIAGDIHEHLNSGPPASGGSPARRHVWHRPCLMTAGAEKAFLDLVGPENLEIVPGGCCGAPLADLSGFLQGRRATRPSGGDPLAEAARRNLRDEIMAAEADRMVTSCPACILRLRADSGLRKPVTHSLALLLQARGTAQRRKGRERTDTES